MQRKLSTHLISYYFMLPMVTLSLTACTWREYFSTISKLLNYIFNYGLDFSISLNKKNVFKKEMEGDEEREEEQVKGRMECRATSNFLCLLWLSLGLNIEEVGLDRRKWYFPLKLSTWLSKWQFLLFRQGRLLPRKCQHLFRENICSASRDIGRQVAYSDRT